MIKKKLLYVSPFWPCRSGISQYSEMLVQGLNDFFDITLLVNGYVPHSDILNDLFPIITDHQKYNLEEFDFILYNFGNNPEFHSYMYKLIMEYGGYIILHDIVLYYLTVGYYKECDCLFQKIFELEGAKGITIVKNSLRMCSEKNLLEHKNIAAMIPLNGEIISAADGIFVHSAYSRDKVLQIDSSKDITVIQHLDTRSKTDQEYKDDFLRSRYGFPKEQFIIGSIGLIGPSKQNKIMCEAVGIYNSRNDKKIVYVMCGDGNYVDSYVDNKYIFKTGFLENEEFFRGIESCDLIANMRDPYNGEASGTLIQCMSLEKICVVTDVGWFGELPDDTVIKVSSEIKTNEVVKILEDIIAEDGLYRSIKENAGKYVNEKCNENVISQQIFNVLTGE